MRKFIFAPLVALILLLGFSLNTTAQTSSDIIISGVIDGPLSGGTPKAVELFVTADINDLSNYGLSSANNGGGTTGSPEYTFPADAASAGDYIYVASESTEFNNWFGFSPDYTAGALAVNGDDAIELFKNSSVVDVFGDVNTDGSGETWEYADGWAYRNSEVGPNPSFTPGDWTYSGPDALDGETTNATATDSFPTASFMYPIDVIRTSEMIGQDPSTTGGTLDYAWDQGSSTLTITQVDPNEVPWVEADGDFPPTSGNWIGVGIDYPAGFTGMNIDGLTVDGNEYEGYIMTGTQLAFYFMMEETGGKATDSHTLVITWSNDYNPETIEVSAENIDLEPEPLNPSITITYFITPQSFEVGTSHTITWDYTDVSGNCQIEIDPGIGVYVDTLAEGIDVTDGEFTMDIPADVGEITNAIIKVAMIADPGVYDETATFDLTDNTPPEAVAYEPTGTSAGIGQVLSLEMNEDVVAGTGNIVIKKYSDDTEFQSIDVTSGNVTITDNMVEITHNDFDYATQYYVEIDNGALEDNYGNAYAGITGNTEWNFTTEDSPATPGQDCANAIEIDFDTDLPYNETEATTCGLGDNYSETDLDYYDGGEDIIYELVVPSETMVSITMTPAVSWTGMGLFDDCPDTGTALYSETNSGSDDRVFENITLSAGTYYLMMDIYPTPDCYNFDLSIEKISCPGPSDLTVDAVTNEDVSLSWTENGSATAWNIVYGAPGFDPLTEGTTVDADANPFTVPGLSPATSYEAYVQAKCGASDFSDWTGPVSFATDCDATSTFPFTEGFEDAAAPPICWSIEYANPSYPAGNEMTHSTDYAYEGSQSFRFASYSYGSPYEQYLITPELDMSSNKELHFWYRKGNNGSEVFAVGTSTTGNDVSTDFTWESDVSDASTTWQEYILNLDASVKYVAIQYKSNYQYYLYIDGFEIKEPPACPMPTDLAVDDVAAEEVTLSWTENGSATAWNIVYGAPGFDPTSEGTTVDADANPFTVPGLTPESDYEAYVQAECGPSDLSDWSSAVSFSTPATCPAPSDLTVDAVTNEDVSLSWTENGSADAWNIVYGAPGFDPLTEGTTVDADANPFTVNGLTSGTQYEAYVQAECGASDLSDWSNMVGFTTANCQAADQCDHEFAMEDSYGDGWNGAYLGVEEAGVEIAQITLDDGSSATLNQALCDGLNVELVWHSGGSYDYEASFTLSDPFGTELFAYTGDDTDDGSVIYTFTTSCTPPACPMPTDLAVDDVAAEEVTLSWTENGSATAWNIVYGAPGFDPTSEGTTVDADANPYTVPGLSPATSYEAYVQAECGPSDFSDWAGPVSFATDCEAVSTYPWDEGFEDDSDTRDCWTQIQETGTNSWTFDTGSSGGTITSAYEGSLNAVFTSSSGGPHVTKLVSPVLDLSSGANYVVDFYFGQESWYGDQNTLKVYYRENGTAAWTEIGDYPSEITTWTFESIELPNPSATYQLAFEGTDNYGRANVIDNVAVRETSTETDFLTYSFPEQTGAADINTTDHTITVEVGSGTDLASLVASFTLSTGATATVESVEQESGVTENDFSSPVTYTVTAEDGVTTQDWIVTVSVADINTETDILTYSFPEQTGPATIDDTEHTVDIEVAWDADVTSLVADYTLSYGATASVEGVDQESGITENDFTDPVSYTITAEDGTTTQDWIVTVNVADIPEGATCATAFDYGMVNDPAVNGVMEEDGAVWYYFTVTETVNNVDIHTCGSDFDTKLAVFEDCADFVEIPVYGAPDNALGYNDDAPGDYCDEDNNQSLIEFASLDPGTYYVLVYPYGSNSGNYELEILGNPLTDYAANTTLEIDPASQTILNGDDATMTTTITYPETVSQAVPSDVNVDAMLDLSNLTTGATVNINSEGTDLGTYTVTGGEIVWASQAFTGVNRVPASAVEGVVLNWDITVSGLDEGDYSIPVMLYAGTDIQLNDETGMTELASGEAMIYVVAEMLTDLELVQPSSGFACDLTANQQVPIFFMNVGNTTIEAGEEVNFSFDSLGGPSYFAETVTLTEALNPGETLETISTNTVDVSALGTYSYVAAIEYTPDENTDNDTIYGFVVHFEQEIEFVDAVEDTIVTASYPYTITADIALTTDSLLTTIYEWDTDPVVTGNELEVNEDGWYYVTAITEDCSTTDSVYVRMYDGNESLSNANIAVYPNPNNGQFMIEFSLPETADVQIGITNITGQTIRESKLDDVQQVMETYYLNNVSEGIYNVRILIGDKQFNRKLIIR